jgi:hypothetical protein
MFNELEILIPGQVPDVRCVAGDQIVDGNDPMTFRQESIAQMRSQKTGRAGYDGNRPRAFLCHSAPYLRAGEQICQSEVENEQRRMTKYARVLK